jgi:NADPH:quinone reductase
MRAARLHTIGGTLQIDDVADPVAGDGEVVVDIAFASVNPLDIWVTRGAPGAAAANLPWIPGTEATGHHDGAPVLVRGAGLGVLRRGLYCQRAAVPRAAIAALPAGTDLAQAAGLGVAGLTAYQCIHPRAQVTAGDRVLVLGASGGVSALAIQIAKATGATVWGQTTSASKVSFIESLGPDRVVVTDAAGLPAAVAELKPTVVLDPLGGPFTDAASQALEPRGRLVVYGTSVDEMITLNLRGLYRKGIDLKGYSGLIDTPADSAAVLTKLLDQLAAGQLRVPVEIVPLSSAANAHQRILDRQVEGKLILATAP